jgi:3-deoxy-D-manno-octulosonic-acid transferase
MTRAPWWSLAAASAAALSTPLLPMWAAISALHPRLRVDWRARWGLEVAPVGPGVVWVHAASVGEVAAAEGLVGSLPGPVLLTADTDTGVARAREVADRSNGRVIAAVRPVDHPWVLAPLWADARPRVVVFVEGAWWPQLVARCVADGVPVVRVSGRIGAATARRLGVAYGAWTAPCVEVIARDEAEAATFRRIGRAPVRVGGDLKAARPAPPPTIRIGRPYWVGASTRGEEDVLVAAHRALAGAGGPPVLVLAPRHPARFPQVAAALAGGGARFVRRTSLPDGGVADAEVVLLDTVGELAGLIPGARAVFVGGTFDPAIGGHSPMEAWKAGVPVVAGPERASNAVAFAGCAATLVDEAHPDAIVAAVRAALAGPPPPPPPTDSLDVARERVLVLASGVAPERPPRPWLAPAAALWGLGARARQARVGLGAPARLGVPVVSVGSTNARGGGKTPTARWLAEQLVARGFVVGVVTRGYRRSRPGRDVRTSLDTTDAADLGDEGALAARAGLLVAAGPDRVEAGRRLVAAGATALVLDDGLAASEVARDLDLLVLDARFPSARGLIPMGERRERDAIPQRVHGVVVHHGPVPAGLRVPAVAARRVFGPWHRGEQVAPAGPPAPVALFAGVARPADVLATMDRPVVRFRALPDHQPIDAAALDRLRTWAGDAPLVCTGKDWVRLPAGARGDVWWRELRVVVDDAPESWFELLTSSQ